MFYTMSAVTNQPLPFGQLEREKHIQMIFRAFQNRCGPCECQSHSKLHPTPPDWDSDEEQLSAQAPERKMENSFLQPAENVNRPGMEQSDPCAAGSDLMSVLETVSQIHISAQPQLQGPQCVPRRIYSITTGSSRSQIFVAVEESSCVCLQCCGPARAYTLKGFNSQGCPVFYFERPFRWDACCLGCCLMEMRVYSPQKHLIGTVRQRWSMFTSLLEVCDSEGATAVSIQGSCCPCRCFSNQQFQIVSNIGERLGTIWKKWPGFNEEHNMDHEYFGLDVQTTIESNMKLLLLAATFLLELRMIQCAEFQTCAPFGKVKESHVF